MDKTEDRTRRIMCIDNSGSTENCSQYWNMVKLIYSREKIHTLVYWNTRFDVRQEFCQYSEGGTDPSNFFDYLSIVKENCRFQLFITTDGQIQQYIIDRCAKHINVFERTDSVKIYYIGNTEHMNIGLNVIFGRIPDVEYFMNSIEEGKKLPRIEELPLIDPDDAEALIIFKSRIEGVKRSELPNKNEVLNDLRRKLTVKFKERSKKKKRESVEKLLKLYESEDCKLFNDELNRLIFSEENKNRVSVENQILNLFDKQASLNIERHVPLKYEEQDLEIGVKEVAGGDMLDEENSIWENVEDAITFTPIGSSPCILLKYQFEERLLTDSNVLKHPFLALKNADWLQHFHRNTEIQNVMDHSTITQLKKDGRNIISPFTRDACRAFILYPRTFNDIKYNCLALSMLFSEEFKMPGNLVLWNCVVLYAIFKNPQISEDVRKIVKGGISFICDNFKGKLTLTINLNLPIEPLPLKVAFWYACKVACDYKSNTVYNVLRSPFGEEVYNFYTDALNDGFGNDSLKERVLKWKLWRLLLSLRDSGYAEHVKWRRELRAQYQNYIEYKDELILMQGPCKMPYPCMWNEWKPNVLYTLSSKLNSESSIYENVDGFNILEPDIVEYPLVEITSETDFISHVQINPKTCYPYEICRVTKLHWKECLKNYSYDVKKESYGKTFLKYCQRCKKYPENYLDLLWFHHRYINREPLPNRAEGYLKEVFKMHEEVMKLYTCEEFLNKAREFADPKDRLKME